MQEQEPEPRHPPTTPQLPSQVDDAFKPICPDCKYDLSAIPSGRCPECGLPYTHARLYREFLARHELKAKRLKGFLSALTLVPLIAPACLLPIGTVWGFVALIVFWTGCGVVWTAFNQRHFLARPYLYLIYLVPIVLLMFVVMATTFGMQACAVLGVMACVVGWFALRGSPLISSIVLLLCVAGPILFAALIMYLTSQADLAAKRYWSSFDQPTPNGWRALPCHEVGSIAIWLAVVGAAIVLVVAFYLRRAIVRLRHRNRPAATAGVSQA